MKWRKEDYEYELLSTSGVPTGVKVVPSQSLEGAWLIWDDHLPERSPFSAHTSLSEAKKVAEDYYTNQLYGS